MAFDAKACEYNRGMGYTPALSADECRVSGRRLYHGRLGGPIAAMRSGAMFFFADAALSSEFTEHAFINGDDVSPDPFDPSYLEAYLAATPVVLAANVTIERPLILDAGALMRIAEELDVPDEGRERFIADFEDSCLEPRERVFSWAMAAGYDGLVIVNDLTPLVAGGDWCFRTSFVAFYPEHQVCWGF